MNIGKVILINVINIIIVGLIIFFSDFLPLPLTIVLFVAWLAFLIYSNYQMIFVTKDILYELEKADRGCFRKEVSITKAHLKSMEGRSEVFDEMDDANTVDICRKVEEQFYTNVKYITQLMKSYDYVMKPAGQKEQVDRLVAQNAELIDKLNKVIEQKILLSKTAYDSDTESIDDLLDALKDMISKGSN